MTLLTVITVVKDDPAGLIRTAASLQPQDRSRVQLVVVDSSTDRDAAARIFADHGLAADLTWTPPAGVYPAMNSGLARADGDYVYFLNAGDRLAAPVVLGDMADRLDAERPLWAVGGVRFVREDGTVLPAPTWDYRGEQRRSFARGRFPAHQAVVLSTEELRRQGGFDVTYRIAADYASIMKASVRSDPDLWDVILAEFTVGGLSTQQWRLAQQEFHRARREILQPEGWDAAVEQFHTVRGVAATTLYRSLWAPGRPLHAAMTRLRRGGS